MMAKDMNGLIGWVGGDGGEGWYKPVPAPVSELFVKKEKKNEDLQSGPKRQFNKPANRPSGAIEHVLQDCYQDRARARHQAAY